MAVTTKTRGTVETKEEPKVIADPNLNKIMRELGEKDKEAGSYWLRIVEYVRDNETPRDVLMQSLIQYRGMKESSASVEASIIKKATSEEFYDAWQKATKGKMGVRDFRGLVTKKGATSKEGEDGEVDIDYEKKLSHKLKAVARFAIEKAEITDAKEFGRLALSIFREVISKEFKAEEDELESKTATESNEPEEEDLEGEEEE